MAESETDRVGPEVAVAVCDRESVVLMVGIELPVLVEEEVRLRVGDAVWTAVDVPLHVREAVRGAVREGGADSVQERVPVGVAVGDDVRVVAGVMVSFSVGEADGVPVLLEAAESVAVRVQMWLVDGL